MADARLAGTRVIQVLVEGSAPDAIKDPEVLKRMDELGTFIAHQPLPVGKVVSIVDLLRQISLAVDPSGGGKLPDTAQGVAQYLLLYGMGGDEEDLAPLVDRPFQRAVITAYLKTDDFRAMKTMTVAMQAEADRLFAGTAGHRQRRRRRHQRHRPQRDDGPRQDHQPHPDLGPGRAHHRDAAPLAAGGLLVLLPLATAALVNLGLMGWTGIMLSMGTAAISAMAVGIGADYAVYFIFRVREEFQRTGDLREATATALTTSGKAIAYVASAVAGGYLCLALSFFKVHVLLGVLVALTMVTSSAATVAFLPAVILLVTPKFLRTAEPAPAARPTEMRRAG